MIFKIKSKAFRQGFAAGVSSPYLLLFGPQAAPRRHSGSTISHAWRDVGRELEDATVKEGESHGKTPGKRHAAARH